MVTRVRRAAAIALCVGLAVGVAGQLNGGLDLSGAIRSLGEVTARSSQTDSPDQAASSLHGVDDQTGRLAAAQRLMAARSSAIKAKSKSAWMATVDLAGKAFRARQSVEFDNLVKLPISQFSYGAVHPAPALSAARLRQTGPTAWVTRVAGTYALAGFDRAPQSFDTAYTLVRRSGGWRLADDTDGVSPFQMWDLPGMRVLHGRYGIVIGNAPESRMRVYRTLADSAVRRVEGVWGKDWSSQVVILTPATSDEFARLLSRASARGLDQVAAITQGVIESGSRAAGDRVVINPKAFTALQRIGRRVVITHELTHIAARSSTTGPVPIWLAEGMSDYVGYSGLGLPRETVASELLALVRAGKGPTALPADRDFDPSRTKIATSYSGSWLAVSRLVDLYGQARVVAFYRVVASAPSADGVAANPDTVARAAFSPSFGVTQAQFVVGWRHYLRTLAQAGR